MDHAADLEARRGALGAPGDAGPFDDDELSALALAADPRAPLADDAVPYDQVVGTTSSLLPDWYMARATAVAISPWRRRVTVAVVAAFLLIDAAGLCSTYGVVNWA